jgi:hypothetical protein
MGKSYSFYVFLHELFEVLTTFGEFLRKLVGCWRPYCAVDAVMFLLSLLLLASLSVSGLRKNYRLPTSDCNELVIKKLYSAFCLPGTVTCQIWK